MEMFSATTEIDTKAINDMTTMNPHHPLDRQPYGAGASGYPDKDVWDDYMLEWYGLTPVRDEDGDYLRPVCPHLLVDENAHPDNPLECPLNDTNSDFWPVIDHARLWTNEAGERVLTVEPWGNPFDMMDKFVALEKELDMLGVATCFEGRSPYGASFVLFLAADNTEAGRRARTRSNRRRRSA